MKIKIIAIAFLILTVLQTVSAQATIAQKNVFAIVGVNVIPMDRERVLTNQTVIVSDGRVAEIGDFGKVKIPQDAAQIDGRGKFLMPGLVDMHLHLAQGEGVNNDLASQQLRLLLANGVTTIRNMIGAPAHLALREKINKGEIPGPTLYTAGPPLLGQNTPTIEAAEKTVTAQKNAGYDLLKVHEGLKPEVYEAITRKAKELGIPFAGHVTFSVGLQRALNARQSSIDHLDNYLQSAVKPNFSGEITSSQIVVGDVQNYIDENKLTELAKETKKANVANNPTLTLFKLVAADTKPEEYLKWEEMKYVPAQMRQNFAKQKAGTLNIPAPSAEKQKYIELRNFLVRELYKAGALLTVGPDSPQFFLVPGFATHHEMQSLSEAGLPNYAVLEAATKNGAEVLGGIKEFGTIEKGKRADLLLLEANPLEKISNTKQIAGVMARGRWFSKSDLRKMLETVEALNNEKKIETSPVSDNQMTTVIALRHAETEKDGTQNPPLSENGKKQVEDLIKALENAGVAAVFTTQFKRTFDTGKPLGEKLGVPVIPVEINGQNLADYHNQIAEKILKEFSGKTVVVIGHSNTVPPIVQALSGKTVPAIDDASEFDALFVVTSKGKGNGGFVRARYGQVKRE